MNNSSLQSTPDVKALYTSCAKVTHFMAYNGGKVLKYEAAEKTIKNSNFVLANSSDERARREAALDAKEAKAYVAANKGTFVHIHVSPEEWTVDDLQKLKSHPKGKAIFSALVSVRDAIYDQKVPAADRVKLAQNLLDTMPPGTQRPELLAFLNRVKTVATGKETNIEARTGAIFDLPSDDIKLNPLEDKSFDQQKALERLAQSGVTKDSADTLKAPLETLVVDAVRGLPRSVALVA